MKKYSALILALTLLLSGCITQMTDKPVSWISKSSCTFTGTYDSPGFLSTNMYPPTYNGTFHCTALDGSNLTCPNGSAPAKGNEFSAKLEFPREFTEENLWKLMGCGAAPAVTSTPTPLPTATTTATPFAAPAAASTPLLTGEVSACSLKDGFINFKLVDEDASFKGSDVYLTINDAQVQCTLAGNNNSLLSCPLPAGVTFPAQIHAAIGDSSTDDFTYDGGGCVAQTGPSQGGEGGVPTSCGVGDCPPP